MPLIVRWPGVIPAGKTDDTTVIGAVDLFPTLCRIAGVGIPSNVKFDGIDQSAALRGKPAARREKPLMWEYGRNEKYFGYPKQPRDRSPNLAIRDGRWKLLVNADGSGSELYDIVADRSELYNLAAERPQITSRLKDAVLGWRHSMP